MKRKGMIIGLLIAICLIMIVGINSCVDQDKRSQKETQYTYDKNLKTLVVYFSATHTTEKIAKYITEEMSSDIYAIEPKEPYTEDDLDYSNDKSRTTLEQNDEQSRPKIKDKLESIEKYDVIFLGYPIWHGQAPRIISTFLESYDFKNKTIVPFCTSHSSGVGSSDVDLHSLVDSSVTWKKGKRFSGKEEKEIIQQWIQTIEFKQSQDVSVFDLEDAKNGQAPTIMLNSGYQMPVVGLGTYSLLDDECVMSVQSALERGYRLFDTASIYNNEESVGKAIRKSGIDRKEVFITTKLYMNQYEDATTAIDEALEKLDVEYIDLMLLHHPGSHDVDAYKAMEQAVRDGKIRSIGLSNWYIDELEEFLPQVSITPAVIQNEIHPYYQENQVIDYIHKKGIVMEGWYPLGGRGHTKELLSNKTILNIANTHHKSAAQVILRWNLQKGVIVIPGSSNPDHILENISIFDFKLTDQEMEQINKLDRNEKHDWY